MIINLKLLQAMHPRLPKSIVSNYSVQAGIALGRHGHISGVNMETCIDDSVCSKELHWEDACQTDADQFDFRRVTEDAAEVIVLAFVYTTKQWVVRRRLQQGERADWLGNSQKIKYHPGWL